MKFKVCVIENRLNRFFGITLASEIYSSNQFQILLITGINPRISLASFL